MISLLASLTLTAQAFAAPQYKVGIKDISADANLAYVRGTSTFQQAFNPSYVEATAGTNQKEGILVRSQNCTASVGGVCTWVSKTVVFLLKSIF